MTDAPNITETRAVLQAITTTALQFANAAEALAASLSAKNLDAETLSNLMDVFEAADGVIRVARRTLDNLNRRHQGMEEAVNATPNAAKTEFYRADGNSGHRGGVVNVASGNANVGFQIGQQFSQPSSDHQTDATPPTASTTDASTNVESGNTQSDAAKAAQRARDHVNRLRAEGVDGSSRGVVNIASDNAHVGFQIGRQFPPHAKADSETGPESSEPAAGRVVNVRSSNAQVGMQTDIVIGDLRIDL